MHRSHLWLESLLNSDLEIKLQKCLIAAKKSLKFPTPSFISLKFDKGDMFFFDNSNFFWFRFEVFLQKAAYFFFVHVLG